MDTASYFNAYMHAQEQERTAMAEYNHISCKLKLAKARTRMCEMRSQSEPLGEFLESLGYPYGADGRDEVREKIIRIMESILK